MNVVVGLRKGSSHWEKAADFAATHPNFKVMEVEEAAAAGDVVMMLVPDELCADIYNKQIAPYMTEGKTLAFAHGFNIHFKTITPPKNVDVIMIAPKGPGHIVRRLYTEGEGCPSLICVEQGLHRQGQGHCPGLCFRHRRRPCRHPGDHLQGGDRDRPVRRAGCAVRRCLRADQGWL